MMMRMMEEIAEMNEEMQMKARWIGNRVKLLSKYAREAPDVSHRMKKLVGNFMLRIKPNQPHKSLRVLLARKGLGTYSGEGPTTAIPLHMHAGEEALEMQS